MGKTEEHDTPADTETNVDERLEDSCGKIRGLAQNTEHLWSLSEDATVRAVTDTIGQLQQQAHEQAQHRKEQDEMLSTMSKDIQILQDASKDIGAIRNEFHAIGNTNKDIDVVRNQIQALWNMSRDMDAIRSEIQVLGSMSKDIPALRSQVISMRQDLDSAGSRIVQSEVDSAVQELLAKQDECTVLRQANAELQELTANSLQVTAERVNVLEGTLGPRIQALEAAFLDERNARLQVLETVGGLRRQIVDIAARVPFLSETSTKFGDLGSDTSDPLSARTLSRQVTLKGETAESDVDCRKNIESSKWEVMDASISQLRAELNYLAQHVRLYETSRSNVHANFKSNGLASVSSQSGRSHQQSIFNPTMYHSTSIPVLSQFGQHRVPSNSQKSSPRKLDKGVPAQIQRRTSVRCPGELNRESVIVQPPVSRMTSVPGGIASPRAVPRDIVTGGIASPAAIASPNILPRDVVPGGIASSTGIASPQILSRGLNRESSPGCASLGEASRQPVIVQTTPRLSVPGCLKSPRVLHRATHGELSPARNDALFRGGDMGASWARGVPLNAVTTKASMVTVQTRRGSSG